MELKQLLQQTTHTTLQGDTCCLVEKIEYDSRKVTKGDVFVCITGLQADGHKFAKMAVEKGATALICEHMPEDISEEITVVAVENSRIALADMSVAFYGDPSKELAVIGITGTNGKTTTTYLLQSILGKIGKKMGIIGTIENRIGDKVIPTERTTPESKELQGLFAQMQSEDVTHVMMEVSSHALDLKRVAGVHFAVGVFTNLTQDHLDYHKTMENYKIAKSELFQMAEKSVINIDDAAGEYMKSVAKGEVLTFGIDNKADLMANNIKITGLGVDFTFDWQGVTYPVHLHTSGKFSVYNALGAIGASLLLGVPVEDVVAGITENKGVRGRFETIGHKKGFQAVVDYAHTPDGLENVLQTASEFVTGRIITVFGCGGDRDTTKRPIMGQIAGNYSGYAIITSDNPRTEDPNLILNDVEVGILETNCDYEKIVDRREAIEKAVSMAAVGDVIVIAGKGHETYQIFANETIHFDDMEEVRKLFGGDCV
ncbi:UDP-N-acetylmuramoyl-L-alanyl-D-glutamate--2,6-diaminopimelate ligase [Chakrabartyella piscis]|uniref:UDP-N-acetylmuramoyl-L-alanyl-D-glutamate--2, 6-diaminopimelate ligase n=1 Tax=Chakrabartyella piscis TaxID=2918914 RepID=UPI002958A87C|nr:UDP-N-acetylmuramoyl-L-alanyl-D-glutamate--2,6-diaminopimelate ligase [Chakrabartyella piscis]